MTILLVIAILIFLIVAHELGHFLAAKFFKVKVEEFGVGYPPRALSLGKIGETEYTLNWIPFGGFVRLFGEDDGSPNKGPGSFVSAKRWKQAIILVAGVVMNALAALLLFTGAYAVGILHPVDQDTPGARLIISDVVPETISWNGLSEAGSGTEQRTIWHPARASFSIWARPAATSPGGVLVIDWMETGWVPPIPTWPTKISRFICPLYRSRPAGTTQTAKKKRGSQAAPPRS
jgi:membrane-associated protease RseP (regulator of RpoE activity)